MQRIAEETQAEIVRLFYAEKWRVGTIASQLGLHHTTVMRTLEESGVPEKLLSRRASMADPFVPFMVAILKKYPKLPAVRLFEMVRLRGYQGTSKGHFRRIVARLRPRKLPEAYLRLRTLPGEQAQVDWGHFGTIQIGRAVRRLSAFVMVLSWSRLIFLRFFPSQRMAEFLRGHAEAFELWGAVPRVVLYDNLKSAVLERRRDAIRFNPQLLQLAAHYRFEPRPVAVARGNEKGRVERAILYIRTSFFPGREWSSLNELNAQAELWCRQEALSRRCPQDHELTIAEAFADEHGKLLPLPESPFPCEEIRDIRIGKTPYARFDLNDYSVPHTHVRTTLVVRATPTRVRIFDGAEVLADHPRSYDRDQQIEDPTHIAALVAVKREAREHRGKDRLHRAAPACDALFVAAAERGDNLGSVTAQLLRLLEQHGAAELECAVAEALERGVPHPNAVRQALERRRQERTLPPPMSVALPDDPRVRGLLVRTHDLGGYDELTEEDP